MIEAVARSVAFDWIETALLDKRSVTALSRLRREFEYRKLFRDAAMRAKNSGGIDLIILPYLDYCFHAIALAGDAFGGVPWAGITMRLKHGAGLDTRRIVMPLLLRQSALRVVFSLTDIEVGRRPVGRAVKLRYLPDPGDLREMPSRVSARRDLGIPNDVLVILVYGTIDHRKGLVPLTAALESAGAPNAVLLVVGRQSHEMRSFLSASRFAIRRSQGLLREVNEFVGDKMQGQAFAAADVVWLGYVGHLAMSGVLVLAGLARRAVIVTRAGEMGRLAQEHQLGPVVDSEDIKEIVDALRAISDPGVRIRSAESCYQTFRAHEAADVGEQLFHALTPSPSKAAGGVDVGISSGA